MADEHEVEAACRAYLSAEFDHLGEAWFHPSERANFIHEGVEGIKPRMAAALAAAEQARWRPTETAPKDGTWFLWGQPNNNPCCCVIRWPEYEACWTAPGGKWMPLPPPPEKNGWKEIE